MFMFYLFFHFGFFLILERHIGNKFLNNSDEMEIKNISVENFFTIYQC